MQDVVVPMYTNMYVGAGAGSIDSAVSRAYKPLAVSISSAVYSMYLKPQTRQP